MRNLRCVVSAGLVACCLTTGVGCGMGGLTQEDMKRAAIRRPKTDEDDAPSTPPPATKPPTTTAAQPREKEDRATRTRVAKEDDPPTNYAPPVLPTEQAAAPVVDSPANPAPSDVQTAGPPADAPTTPEGRAQLSRENMARIGIALNRYVSERGAFPTPAMYDGRKRPLLSWRVALLPYLGYANLYQQFDRDEPWNSRHNQSLLAQIPPIYQSPERWDENTNYQVVTGRATLFPGGRPVAPRRIEDGRENVLAVVEVDDQSAVPWTKPDDYAAQMGVEPLPELGALRDGIFLGILADGEVIDIPADLDVRTFWGALTFDGGEPITVADLASLAEGAPAPVRRGGPRAPRDDDDDDPVAPARVAATPTPRRQPVPTKSRAPQVMNWPVPGDEEIRVAKKLVKELFQEKFQEATSKSERAGVAREMLDMATSVGPTERYVLLDVAMDVATASGDFEVSKEILDEFVASFDVDEVDIWSDAGKELGRSVERQHVESFSKWAAEVGQLAIRAERHKEGEQLISTASARASKHGSEDLRREMREIRETMEFGRELRHSAETALEELEDDPENGKALTTLGRYLCFVKEDWRNGLPILATCASPKLKELAELELKEDTEPSAMLTLADKWWDSAINAKGAQQRAMGRRAAFWYRRSLDGLPPGLLTIRAEKRLERLAQLEPEEGEEKGR